MITQLITKLGADAAKQRKTAWKSELFVADASDVAYGCVLGNHYKIVVAQEDGTSKSGKPFTKGEWFILDVK